MEKVEFLNKKMLFCFAIAYLQFVYMLGGMKQPISILLPFILGYFCSKYDMSGGWVNKRTLMCSLTIYFALYLLDVFSLFRIHSLLLSYFKSIVTYFTCSFIINNHIVFLSNNLLKFSDNYSYIYI